MTQVLDAIWSHVLPFLKQGFLSKTLMYKFGWNSIQRLQIYKIQLRAGNTLWIKWGRHTHLSPLPWSCCGHSVPPLTCWLHYIIVLDLLISTMKQIICDMQIIYVDFDVWNIHKVEILFHVCEQSQYYFQR